MERGTKMVEHPCIFHSRLYMLQSSTCYPLWTLKRKDKDNQARIISDQIQNVLHAWKLVIQLGSLGPFTCMGSFLAISFWRWRPSRGLGWRVKGIVCLRSEVIQSSNNVSNERAHVRVLLDAHCGYGKSLVQSSHRILTFKLWVCHLWKFLAVFEQGSCLQTSQWFL